MTHLIHLLLHDHEVRDMLGRGLTALEWPAILAILYGLGMLVTMVVRS